MMVGALGLASAEEKISVGYGGEAGNMDESLERLVKKHCGDVLVITRNEESRTVLDKLRVPTRVQERLHHQHLLVGVVGPIPCTPHHSMFIWEHSSSRPKVCVFSIELF